MSFKFRGNPTFRFQVLGSVDGADEIFKDGFDGERRPHHGNLADHRPMKPMSADSDAFEEVAAGYLCRWSRSYRPSHQG